MKYISTLKRLKALWDANSPEAEEITDKVVESVIEDTQTYAKLNIYMKGGRTISMRIWVSEGGNITDHNLWKGLTEWLNDKEDDTPYFFNADDNNYHTHIVKSEVTQVELVKEKDKK